MVTVSSIPSTCTNYFDTVCTPSGEFTNFLKLKYRTVTLFVCNIIIIIDKMTRLILTFRRKLIFTIMYETSYILFCLNMRVQSGYCLVVLSQFKDNLLVRLLLVGLQAEEKCHANWYLSLRYSCLKVKFSSRKVSFKKQSGRLYVYLFISVKTDLCLQCLVQL